MYCFFDVPVAIPVVAFQVTNSKYILSKSYLNGPSKEVENLDLFRERYFPN